MVSELRVALPVKSDIVFGASMLGENGFHRSRLSAIMKEMEILKEPKADGKHIYREVS